MLRGFIFWIFTAAAVPAQNPVSGVVNRYTPVVDFDYCLSQVTVENGSIVAPGDRVLIIQMKGLTINRSQPSSHTDPVEFGSITAVNNTGLYEFSEVLSVSGNVVTLAYQLLNSYTPADLVQMIYVPKYSGDVVINGTLTAAEWNGVTGGVLALEVEGTLTFAANVDVSGKGFRGGAVTPMDHNVCPFLGLPYGFFMASQPEEYDMQFVAGRKGEGAAHFGEDIRARGAMANGGGGGNRHNGGGGGGGGFAQAGRGGNINSSNGCGAGAALGGEGGRSLQSFLGAGLSRVFLGGGGGSGEINNYSDNGNLDGQPSGRNGGGLVFIRAGAIDGNNRSVSANGFSAPVTYYEGAGGGGGGGGIFIVCPNVQNLTLNARGGKGGDVWHDNTRCMGPGGGGGGGVVALSSPNAPPTVVINVAGGQNGINVLSEDPINNAATCLLNNAPEHGAAPGQNGLSRFNYQFPQSSAVGGPPALTLVVTPHPCPQNPVGNITAVATGGSPPLEYSVDGGSFQTNPVFTGLTPGLHTFRVRDQRGCESQLSAAQTYNYEYAAPTAVVVNASCGNNGEISAAVNSGQTPHTFILSPGTSNTTGLFTGLAPGSYTLTARDANGCAETLNLTVAFVPTDLAATANVANAVCSGGTGSVSIVASGGIIPYEYSLDGGAFVSTPNFSNLAIGAHGVVVRDRVGCTVSVNFNVGPPANALTVAATVTQLVSCTQNGAVRVDATGGNPPYQYALQTGAPAFQTSNVFTNLAYGSYVFVVRDAAGCELTTAAQVDSLQPGPPTFNFVIERFAGCPDENGVIAGDGRIRVVVSGGTPPFRYSSNGTTFQASNIFDPVPAGNYLFFVADAAQCTTSRPFAMTPPDEPLNPVFSFVTPTCPGGSDGSISVGVSNGLPPYSFQLDGGVSQSGTTVTYSNLAAGTYSVRVADAYGCVVVQEFVLTDPERPIQAVVQTLEAPRCRGQAQGRIRLSVRPDPDDPDGFYGTPPFRFSANGVDFQDFVNPTDVTGLDIGQEYVYYFMDANGCRTTATINFDGPDTVLYLRAFTREVFCAGDNSGVIFPQGGGGTPPYEYRLQGVDVPINIDYTAVDSFPNLPAGEYRLWVRDALNCGVTQELVVLLRSRPPLLFETDRQDLKCFDDNSGRITVSVSGGTRPYRVLLEGINDDYVAGAPLQTTFVFSQLAAAPQVRVIVVDSAGCRVSGPIFSLSEPPALEALTVSTKAVRCAGEKNGYVAFRITGGTPFAEGNPYRVFFAGTLRRGQEVDTLVNLSGGNYSVPVRDANGCETVFGFVIGEADELTVTPGSLKPETCEGDRDGSVTFNVTGGATPYSFVWSHNPNLDAPTANGLAPGRYELTVTDAYGCVRKSDVLLGGGFARAGDDRQLCVENGRSSPLFLGTGQPQGGQWTGPGLMLSNGAAYFDYALVGQPGTYTLAYTYGPCRDEVKITVTEALRFPISNVCRQDAGTISLPDPGAGFWELDGKRLSQNAVDLSSLNNGRHVLRHWADERRDCGTESVFFIRSEPRAAFAPTAETLAVGAALIEFENLTRGENTYSWDFGDGSTSNETHPKKQFLLPGVYTVTLTATNDAGCRGQTSRTYTIIGAADSMSIAIPNAFSPNGDGVNDEWTIFAPSMKKQKVEIYGRWGHRVYLQEIDGLLETIRWDGTYLNQPVPEGVFVYKYTATTFSGMEAYRVGTITIIR